MTVVFREALAEEYRKWKKSGIPPSPFAFYCGLSDRIGSDYSLRKKAGLLLEIDERTGLVSKFLSGEPDAALDELRAEYQSVSYLLNYEAYENLLLILAYSEAPQRFPLRDGSSEPEAVSVRRKTAALPSSADDAKMQSSNPAKPISKTNFKKSGVGKAVVQRAPTPAPSPEPTTPLGTTTPTYNYSSHIGKYIAVFIAISAIITGIIAFVKMPWSVRAWLIGIFGGIFVTAVLFGAAYIMEENLLIDGEVSLLFMLPALMIINFVLLMIFKTDYKVIFGCLSVFQALLHIFCAVVCFDGYEKSRGYIHSAELAVNIIVMFALLI